MDSDNQVVSVILPIYNAGRYLDQALASVEEQTYDAIEIICVNDGSTDDSLTIMRAQANRDSRIRVINQPNRGYGAAMNRGIAEATGTWIAILEPDDWIEPDAYSEIVRGYKKKEITFDEALSLSHMKKSTFYLRMNELFAVNACTQ